MAYSIYLITNIANGKIYVGQTKSSIQARLKQHIRWAIKIQANTFLCRAIRKYSIESFTITQLTQVNTKEEANNEEILKIKELRSYDPEVGYNSTFGGDNIALTEETKQRIAKTLTGRKLPPEHCKAISEGIKRAIATGAKVGNKRGVPFSEEHKRAISQGRLQGKPTPAFTTEHSQRISDGLRTYWSRRKSLV